MASPQAENGHVRIATELFSQLVTRNFTKRQRSILDLIIRLSYGCNKRTAHIPKLSSYIACGVDKHHIKKELLTLVELDVLGASSDLREIWIQKDYDRWQIAVPDLKASDAFDELLRHNLSGCQNLHRNEDEGVMNGNHQVTPDYTAQLPQRELETPAIPRGSRAEGTSINSNKQSIDTTTTKRADFNAYFDAIENRMRTKTMDPSHTVQGNSYRAVETLFDEGVPLQFVIDGIDETFETYQPRGRINPFPNFAYCAARIEDRWARQNNQSDPEGGHPYANSRRSAPAAHGSGLRGTQAGPDELTEKFLAATAN